MNRAKHTPGPWQVFDCRELGGGFWIGIDHPEFGHLTHAETRMGCDEAAALGDELANARLIAAAPDLLDALKAAQAVLAQLIEPDMTVGAGTVYFQAKEAEAKARAAIAKATGAA